MCSGVSAPDHARRVCIAIVDEVSSVMVHKLFRKLYLACMCVNSFKANGQEESQMVMLVYMHGHVGY